MISARQLLEEAKRRAEASQQRPVIQSLANHVKNCWTYARDAKRDVEDRMFKSLRQRRGEYEPDVLQRIRKGGGSEIYMMLTAVKCRAAASWLRDTILGVRNEKPWTLSPTPIPTLPPDKVEELKQQAVQQLAQYYATTGMQAAPQEVRNLLMGMRDEFMGYMQDEAKKMVERMELRMEDQLIEGGFMQAANAFIDDLTTFPAAFLKGPVVRNKPAIQWVKGPDGQYTLDFQNDLKLEWERVSPFDIYPSPASEGIDDGYLIQRHRLRRADLAALRGVEGYNEDAITAVLDEYAEGGLTSWLADDTERASAEGKDTSSVTSNPDGLIDALQYWGTVSGKMLLEYGMEESEVEDPTKEYYVEVWLVGNWVIKALMNYHPLGLKPYYMANYEDIPGSFWGNSVADLCRDTQDMCNGAARAIANNLGIASGPQVVVNIDRLPPGEEIEEMYPWKLWQTTSDLSSGSSPAVSFFQPSSNVVELMAVFEKFSILADEFTGIPRYMTGDSPAGGAGRTASGMSMLMNNASKSIKQVVSNIDVGVITPMLERLYFYNMKYSDDPELKGDVVIVARGAMSIMLKEAAQVRRNEFLQTTANPIDMQIIGIPGRAEVLREVAKGLDIPTEKVVPSAERLRQQQAMMQAQQQMLASPQGGPSPSGQELQNGAPVTDNFSPPKR